jgi:diguanylate cyclase (GGDEF)-like protein
MTVTIEFLKAILNTVSEHIVVIDKHGVIQCVNYSWKAFGKNNSYSLNSDWYSVNYLDVCDASAATGDNDAKVTAAGIRKVINNESDSFHLEYPCHSPDEQRWFIMRINPFNVDHRTYYVISHQNITERKLAEEAVLKLSRLDGLCNIPNRRYFDEFLKDEWNRCARLKMPISLAMIDIDYFKLLNDTYGHQAGDECLKVLASLLKEFVQRPSDLCARYGGEEFALIFGNTTFAQSLTLIEKLKEQIRLLHIPNQGSSISPIVTVSIGLVAIYPDNSTDENTLIKVTDDLLYRAKNSGRNQIISQNFELKTI